MGDSLNQSLNELGHHVSCLYTSSGEQLDDIFRLHSKFVNDMRGICINLGNFFSSFVPLLDSFVIGPKNLLNPQDFVSHFNKLTVADLLNISKSELTLSNWNDLKLRYSNSGLNLDHVGRFTGSVELHNDLLQELVNRSSEFDKPQKYSEANPFLHLGVSKSRLNKDWKGLLKWTLSKTDPNEKRDPKPMSKEDVEFLEGAMSSVHEHDKMIANCVNNINTLSRLYYSEDNSTSKEPQLHTVILNDKEKNTLLESLDKLEEHFEEHPSNSSSLVRAGLLDSFILLLKSHDNEILSSTLSIISCSLSNNESVLEDVSKSQLIPTLLELRNRVSKTHLEPKLIGALSSSVRNCRRAEVLFMAKGGLEYLKDCITSDNIKTRERSVLFLNHYISLNRISRLLLATLNPYNMMKSLLPLDPVKNGIQFSEHSCTLISLLMEKHKNILTKKEFDDMIKVLEDEFKHLDSLQNEDYSTMKNLIKNAKNNTYL